MKSFKFRSEKFLKFLIDYKILKFRGEFLYPIFYFFSYGFHFLIF